MQMNCIIGIGLLNYSAEGYTNANWE